MNSIPCCFFPCQIIIVDDDQKFLSQLSLIFDKRRASYHCCTIPQEALHYINQLKAPSPILAELSQGVLNEDIKALYKEIYNPNRFNRISTVIVDYDMPGMNGLTLCQEIKDPYIQKILITGVEDEKIAVDAFNKGIINHYVKKQGTQICQELNTYLLQCQTRYFNLHSQTYLNSLPGNFPLALKDPIFIEFFTDFIEKNNITEYYLLDPTGTFLCLNSQGISGLFFLFKEGDLSYQETSEALPSSVPPSLNRVINSLGEESHMSQEVGAVSPGKGLFAGTVAMEDLKSRDNFQRIKENYYWTYKVDVENFKRGDIIPFDGYTRPAVDSFLQGKS